MSIKLMTKVWDEAPFDTTTLLLLLCLADHANDEGRCWPSVTRLAERARCSERWARDRLKELAGTGWLEREERPGRTTMYRLVFPEPAQTPEPQFTPEDTSPLNPSSGVEAPEESSPLNPTSGVPRNPSSPHPGTPVPPNHKEPSFESSEVEVVKSPEPRAELRSLRNRNGWTPGERAMRTARDTAVVTDIPLHITKYELWCAENKKQPNDVQWLKWLVRDEREARALKAQQDAEARRSKSWHSVAE